MKIADLGQLGYLPLQCFDPRYALEVRPALFATRVQSRWSDSLGRYVQEPASSGDVLCSFLWKPDGGGVGAPGGAAVATGGGFMGGGAGGGLPARKLPGWAFGWPAIAAGDAPGAPKGDDDVNAYGAPGAAQPGALPNFGGGFAGIPQTTSGPKPGNAASVATILPVYDTKWTPDTRFASKQIAVPPGSPPVVKGTVGLAFAGTREHSQEELFFPLDGAARLVAPHAGGDFWRATHVYDLDKDNKLDQVLKAKLHQLLRVVEVPKHCGAATSAVLGALGRPGNHSLELQMGTARGGLPGNLLLADDRFLGAPSPEVQDHGVATYRLSGPLSVGTCSKHLYWPADPANTKGERFRPLHFSPNAYWDDPHVGCGPLEFTQQPYPKAEDHGVPTKVYLSYDLEQPHAFFCGQRKGMWRWWTTTPIYRPPVIDRTQPGREDGFLTYPGLAPDPGATLPGDGGDEITTTPADDVITSPGVASDEPSRGESSPAADPHFTTDPAREAFQSRPGSLADPGPNASHTVRDVGIPGLTLPETDPWDGPGNATQPQIHLGGQPGAGAGQSPLAVPFGLSFLESVAPLSEPPPRSLGVQVFPDPPRSFDASQTARAKLGVGLETLAIAQETAFSAQVWRAQPLAPGLPTYLNSFGVLAPSATNWIDGASPVVARLEPFAQTRGGFPVFNGTPGSTRYAKEASGGLVFAPPGVGLEQIFDGKTPSSLSTTSFVMYSGPSARSFWSIGTPCFATGQIKDGYRVALSTDGRTLTWDKANAAGVIAEVPPLALDDTTQQLRLYGVPVTTDANDCCAAFFGDGSTGTVDLDGVHSYGWASLSGSTYQTTQDVFPENLTVRAGITFNTSSYKVVVSDTCTVEAGAVLGRDGFDGNGSSGVGGGGVASASLSGSASGGNGATASGVGNAGGNETNSLGGAGGYGGNARSGVLVPPGRSTAGTATAPAADKGSVRVLPGLLTGETRGAGGSAFVAGGAGGGGGSYQQAAGVPAAGGGGGGGGGVVVLAARTLVNLGRISANGGNGGGGNATGPVTDAAAGGGGGGGGGLVIVVYGSAGSTLGTVTASGGAGGAGATNGGATAESGHAGVDGTVIPIAV